ncbi:MAG: hypothetical protein GW880_04165, partial [Armatimonadetes bacterium]|nr:hypothetical protein [Armatimonadota bacterium]
MICIPPIAPTTPPPASTTMPPNPNPDTHNQQPPKFEIQQLAVSYSGK